MGSAFGRVVRAAPDTYIVFHGDSITEGYGTSDYGYGNANQKSYPYLVVSGIAGRTFGLVNNGLSGQGLNYVYNSPPSSKYGTLTADAVARVDPVLQKSGTKKLVVFAGTNDIFLNSATGAATAALLQTYVSARISAGWTASDIVVVTMLPRQNSHEADRTALNSDIRTKAATVGYAVADAGADATIGPAAAYANTTYYADGIHPTDAGHVIIAGLVSAALGL